MKHQESHFVSGGPPASSCLRLSIGASSEEIFLVRFYFQSDVALTSLQSEA